MLTLVIDSSYTPIEVTIRSSNGSELTSSIPIRHSHIATTPILEERSYTSTTVRECPLPDTYASRSWCEHEVSPQQFRTFCSQTLPSNSNGDNPFHQLLFEGRCAQQEVCVGSNAAEKGLSHQAYCVATDRFANIGHDAPPSGRGPTAGSSGVVVADFNPALLNTTGRSLAVEAVLTSSNNVTSLFADSVVMQAQAQAQDGVWLTVANGRSECLRCSSLSLKPFPDTGERVKVDVVLPESTPVGLLWLASYTY